MGDPVVRPSWLDRAIGFLSPAAGLRRVRARAAAGIIVRHYEGAASGSRTQGWRRDAGDANAAMMGALGTLRATARDLVRNNGHAESALTTIGDHVVGWGIVGKPAKKNAKAVQLWEEWAGTTACDADGRQDFAGLQKLVMRTVVESGEALVRRRLRRPEDGLPIPMQVQVLEPDYLDASKTGINLPNGGRIIYGVEYDVLGKRAAYWLFKEHPGSVMPNAVAASVRVPAESVLHIYRQDRASQVRGVSWFAPVMLRFKDFDDYTDATIMKQKIAACLAVVTSDVDGSAPAIGTATGDNGLIDSLEPGLIANLAPGRTISVVNPPSVREYADYSKATLREMATGLGVSYEDLTGDYAEVNFSSARMARLRHWARVYDWQWRVLIPQFCDPVWGWAMEIAGVFGAGVVSGAKWTAPPMPMIEPDKEGLAYQRNIRTGIMTLSEAIRERGYDPQELLTEMAADNALLDKLGLVLDSDARQTTQQGLARVTTSAAPAEPAAAATPPPVPSKKPNGGAQASE
jgi:lambda family phage portal protein